MGVYDLRFGIWGLGFLRVYGLGSGVEGLGFIGFRNQLLVLVIAKSLTKNSQNCQAYYCSAFLRGVGTARPPCALGTKRPKPCPKP